jgi:hypothetical protein
MKPIGNLGAPVVGLFSNKLEAAIRYGLAAQNEKGKLTK